LKINILIDRLNLIFQNLFYWLKAFHFQHHNLKKRDELTEFLLYNDGNGDVRVETYLHNETLWLPQAQIAQLFDVQVPAISKHLKNIFETKALNNVFF
jgi:predicted XRE-type DNA-binding protein